MVLLVALNRRERGAQLYKINPKVKLLIIMTLGHSWDLLSSLF